MIDEELNKLDIKAQLIDDFLYTILVLKTSDFGNRSLLFLEAHLIELLIKTTCDKLGVPFEKNHNIVEIGRRLEEKVPNLVGVIPTEYYLKEYRKIWIPGDGSNNIVHLPPIEIANEEMDKNEVAFIMDNIVNLKYGFNKEGISTSNIFIAHPHFNSEIRKLFNICRPLYTQKPIPKKILDLWGKINRPYKGIAPS